MFEPKVVERISSLLNLPSGGWEQDWPLEVADAERVGEFIRAYDTLDLSSDEREALMSLVLASADLYCGIAGGPPAEWQIIVERLARFSVLHERLIDYWSRRGDDDPEGWLFLTPYIRDANLRP